MKLFGSSKDGQVKFLVFDPRDRRWTGPFVSAWGAISAEHESRRRRMEDSKMLTKGNFKSFVTIPSGLQETVSSLLH